MTQYYVYIYFDPTRDNQPMYVGKGKNKRAFAHLRRRDSHKLVERIAEIRAAGLNPKIDVINCVDEANALRLEEILVAHIGRMDLGEGPLLNLTSGGQPGPSGYKHTEESKRKMSERKKGQPCSELRRAAIIEGKRRQYGK